MELDLLSFIRTQVRDRFSGRLSVILHIFFNNVDKVINIVLKSQGEACGSRRRRKFGNALL